MSEPSASGAYQGTLHARPEPQVVETARNGRTLVCPDCGQPIGPSRGGHELPDGRRVHGWACSACQNVFLGTCHSREAPTWNDRIRGLEVEFRDGSRRFVAAIRDGKYDTETEQNGGSR